MKLVVAILLSSVLSVGRGQDWTWPNTDTTPSVVTDPATTTDWRPSSFTTEFPLWSSTTNGSTYNPNSTTHQPNETTTTPRTQPTSHDPTVPTPTLPPNPTLPSNPWNLSYSGGVGNHCIMAEFASQIEVTYENILGEEVKTGFDLPVNASVDQQRSHCYRHINSSVLALNFQNEHISDGLLMLTFKKNKNNRHSTLSEIEVSFLIDEDLFPGLNESYTGKQLRLSIDNLTLFETMPNQSYSCEASQQIKFVSIDVLENVPWELPVIPSAVIKSATLTTEKIKVQAFLPSDQNIDRFLKASTCSQDNPSNASSIIPLTVGGVLLLVVVLVLIAYFIGRSRQPQQQQQHQRYSTM